MAGLTLALSRVPDIPLSTAQARDLSAYRAARGRGRQFSADRSADRRADRRSGPADGRDRGLPPAPAPTAPRDARHGWPDRPALHCRDPAVVSGAGPGGARAHRARHRPGLEAVAPVANGTGTVWQVRVLDVDRDGAAIQQPGDVGRVKDCRRSRRDGGAHDPQEAR